MCSFLPLFKENLFSGLNNLLSVMAAVGCYCGLFFVHPGTVQFHKYSTVITGFLNNGIWKLLIF